MKRTDQRVIFVIVALITGILILLLPYSAEKLFSKEIKHSFSYFGVSNADHSTKIGNCKIDGRAKYVLLKNKYYFEGVIDLDGETVNYFAQGDFKKYLAGISVDPKAKSATKNACSLFANDGFSSGVIGCDEQLICFPANTQEEFDRILAQSIKNNPVVSGD